MKDLDVHKLLFVCDVTVQCRQLSPFFRICESCFMDTGQVAVVGGLDLSEAFACAE